MLRSKQGLRAAPGLETAPGAQGGTQPLNGGVRLDTSRRCFVERASRTGALSCAVSHPTTDSRIRGRCWGRCQYGIVQAQASTAASRHPCVAARSASCLTW